MKKVLNTTTMVIILVILLLIPLIIFKLNKRNTQTENKYETLKQDNPMVIVEYPKPNTVVSSPLVIKGRAKGTWFFEGSFPITLYYGVSGEITTTYATAQGDWMTEDYVPFTATVEFPKPSGNEGLLVLTKADPSGGEIPPEDIAIPVTFK